MKCAYCGTAFVPLRFDQTVCNKACSTNYKNLEMLRAKRLYRALYHWRYGRLSRGKRLSGPMVAANLWFICREIAAWVREDESLGRPPPPQHDHGMNRGHQRTIQLSA
jgi:hypothetical protein